MIRGSNPGHPARLTPYYKVLEDAVRCYLVMLYCSPARLTPYYKVLEDAVRCYLVMLYCSDCNGYKALATSYNTK